MDAGGWTDLLVNFGGGGFMALILGAGRRGVKIGRRGER